MRFLVQNRLWTGLLAGLVFAGLVMLLWWMGLFRSAQLSATDLYFVEQPTSDRVVVVALDDNSLQRYGRSPAEWDRGVYADLLDWLTAAQARVVAFDLVFSEPGAGDARFVQSIAAARQNEARTRVVVSSVGIGVPQSLADAGAVYPRGLAFDTVLDPVPDIYAAISMTGIVNAFADADNRVRRQPSVIVDGDEIRLSLPLAIYLNYLRIPAAAVQQVVTSEGEKLFVTPERALAVDLNGMWLQNFFGPPASESRQPIPIIPLLDVLEGRASAELFADRVVLVGLYTLTGERDRYPVPSGRGALMAGVEIQAHAVESLIQNSLPQILPDLFSALLLGALAIGSSLVFVIPRWNRKLLLLALLEIGWLITALVVFNLTLLILPLFYPMLLLAVICVFHISLDTSREIRLRWRSEFLLRGLSQVSEQRLQMDAILPMLADEVQELLPGSSGAIFTGIPETWQQPDYLWGQAADPSVFLEAARQCIDQESIFERHSDAPGGLPFYRRRFSARNSGGFYHEGRLLAVPVRWQGQTLAAIAVQHRSARRYAAILSDFAVRMAPAIENALLYSEVLRQSGMLANVLVNTPLPIMVLDGANYIQLCNEPANQVMATRGAQGYELLALLTAREVDEPTRAMLREHLSHRESFQTQIVIGEQTFTLNAAAQADMGLRVLVLNNVTHFIETSDLKTRMLRMASHDLKNPLSRIIGYIHMVQDRAQTDEKISRYLSQMNKAADDMQELITEILSLERARRGVVEKEPFDLVDSVRTVYHRSEPDAERKRQQLSLDLPMAALPFAGDAHQIGQAFSNLIGNAIKYTPDEGVIRVRLAVVEQMVRFEVEDTGYGIPKEAQERLFTEFYRVRTEQTARISGTGLGLSLVRSVAEAHGGTVHVESDEGKGSTFTMELPLPGEEAHET